MAVLILKPLGGPGIVCSRWDQEVRETRHKIMAAARFLLKNDMKFVAERDVETHIWKTVYYQVIILKIVNQKCENLTLFSLSGCQFGIPTVFSLFEACFCSESEDTVRTEV